MIAIILLNMGGPDSLEAVRPFLFNLFTDRYIIELGPKWLQPAIAWWIAKKRAPKSEKAYAQIGGKTPLLPITNAQANALEKQLRKKGIDVICRVGMRYWHPRTPDVLNELKKKGIKKVLALSLYPHYSRVTSETSIIDFKQAAGPLGFNYEIIARWPDAPGYILSLSNLINEAIKKYKLDPEAKDFELVYSAHSMPQHMVDEGDPYPEEIKKTIHELERLTDIKGSLCFQSRSGPVKWLKPYTDEHLKKLASQGKKNILIVPISFVSDHIETLYEIDIEYKEMLRKLGANLFRIESLNTRPEFISFLAALVEQKFKEAKWLK